MKKILQGLLLLAVMAVCLILVAMSLDASSPDFVSERGMVSWQDDYEKMYTLDYTTETVIKVKAKGHEKDNDLELRIKAEVTDGDEIEGTMEFYNVGLLGQNVADEVSFSGDSGEITFESVTPVTVEADFLFMPTPAEARAEDLHTDCEDEIFSLISLVNPELAEEIEDMDLVIREQIHESSVSTGDIYRYSGLRAEGETVIVPASSIPEKYELSLTMYQNKTFENEYDRMEDIARERPGYFEKLWYNITHIGEFFDYTLGND